MAFRDLPGILAFNEKTIARVAKTPRETVWAHVIAYVAVVVSYLVAITVNAFRMPGFFDDPLGLLVLAIFVFLLAPAVLIAFTWTFAALYRVFSMLFSGSGSVRGLFRVRGHGSALQALGFIPYAAIPILLYQLALDVQFLRVVEKLELWQALVVVAVTVLSLVFVIFTVLLLTAFWIPGLVM